MKTPMTAFSLTLLFGLCFYSMIPRTEAIDLVRMQQAFEAGDCCFFRYLYGGCQSPSLVCINHTKMWECRCLPIEHAQRYRDEIEAEGGY